MAPAAARASLAASAAWARMARARWWNTPAGLGELHPSATPLKQRRLQLLFEVLHLAAERGLGHAQSRRRMGKVQFFSHRNKVAQVSQFHALTIPGTHGWTK